MRKSVTMAALAVLLLSAGCGSDLDTFHAFKDVREAPPALRDAARAVVKITAENDVHGTAFFVSADGLLVTNNHVVGMDPEGGECAREGCWVSLDLNYQRGAPIARPEEVFAEPIAVSVELDASLFQIRLSKGGPKFPAPAHLTVRPLSSAELDGTQVYVLGHPAGGLKKVTEGRGYHANLDWFESTIFTLGGSSGSPYLDEQGRAVGLHHRHWSSPGSVGRADVVQHGVGTSGAALRRFLDARPGRDLFFAVEERHSPAEMVTHHAAYLGYHKGEGLPLAGTGLSILRALGDACDAALGPAASPPRHASPDDFETSLEPCRKSWEWINCRNLESEAGYRSCPEGVAADAWRARFVRMADGGRRFHSDRFLDYQLSPSRLEKDTPQRLRVLADRLQAHVERDAPALSFRLAYHLLDAGGSNARFKGSPIAPFVRSYWRKRDYQHHFGDVVDALNLLYFQDAITKTELADHLDDILGDRKLPLASRISIEKIQYREGLLR